MQVVVRIGEFKGANKARKAAKFLKEKTQCIRRASYDYNMDEDNGYMAIDVRESNGVATTWAFPHYISSERLEGYKRHGSVVKQIFFCADTIPVGEL